MHAQGCVQIGMQHTLACSCMLAFCIYVVLHALIMHFWAYFMHARGMQIATVFAYILHVCCMNIGVFWAKITHAKCVLSCSVPFVCILTCRSVRISLRASGGTCCLSFWDGVCMCISHAFVMHIWAYYMHAQGCVLACSSVSLSCKGMEKYMLYCSVPYVVAYILHVFCMSSGAFWAKTTHAKCVLSCSVPSVCILACRFVWILLHALARTCCLFWGDVVCICILHALVMHFWHIHACTRHANCIVVLACILHASGNNFEAFWANAY